MARTQNKGSRIQSIEVCRLVAAVFVVFLHFPFPGTFGAAVNSLARFAVPFFFMVSGYFSYGASPEELRRRCLSTVKLVLAATLLYLAGRGFVIRFLEQGSLRQWLRGYCTSETAVSFLLLNVNPLAGHLWYLNSAAICYLVLEGYTRFAQALSGANFRYRPLYQVGSCLLLVYLVLGPLSAAAGQYLPAQLYRNAWFFGLPLFVFGIFLGEYHGVILEQFRLKPSVLVAWILAGAVLTLTERAFYGPMEMHIGSLITVTALLLLLIAKPDVTGNPLLSAAISRCGRLSAWIYVSHLLVEVFYVHSPLLLRLCRDLGEPMEEALRPVVILLICLVTGIFWECLRFVRLQLRSSLVRR